MKKSTPASSIIFEMLLGFVIVFFFSILLIALSHAAEEVYVAKATDTDVVWVKGIQGLEYTDETKVYKQPKVVWVKVPLDLFAFESNYVSEEEYKQIKDEAFWNNLGKEE